MADADISMATADLSGARREYWPDFALGGAYTQRSIIPDSWELMFGIRIPIAPWSIGSVSGRVAERTASLSAAESNRDNMRLMVSYDVQDHWNRMNSQWDQTERYRRAIIPEARQVLESLQRAYQTNSADFLSLIDAFRMLQMFEMEQIMAEMEYQMSRATLEEAVGVELL
jgi:outer membrane protein TolC